MRRAGIIILAAGASLRLGKPKQLLPFQGRSLLHHAAQTALASICRPVIVVLGAHAENIKKDTQDLPVIFVQNPAWELGMGCSIKIGLEAMQAIEKEEGLENDGVLLMVSDQPFITPAILNHLAYTFAQYGGIVASAYDETLGVPAIFGREFHADLISLSANEGAKSLLQGHPKQVHAINFPEGGIDIDTPEDYEQLVGGKLRAVVAARGALLRNAVPPP